MVVIRFAGRSDVKLVTELIHEMGEYERLPVSMTAEQLARDGFGERADFRVLIAEIDGQAGGYALFFYCYSTFRGRGLFLEDLFVRQQFRGKKIGDALLVKVATIAREEECFGIMLNVLEWNLPAVKFFQKHGARMLEEWKTACFDGAALQALAK